MNYNEVKAVNNSLLRYLDPEQGGSPFKFYKEFNNPTEKEEKDYEKFGTALHCYILEPKKFEEIYLIERFERDLNYKLIEESLKFQPDYNFTKLIDLLANDFMEKKAAKKEETRSKHYKERYAELEMYETKFNFLKSCKGKKVLSQDEYAKIVQIDLNIKQHPVAGKLIEGLVKTEYEVYSQWNGIDVKAKLDGIGTDYIIDIKTTSSSNYCFRESFEKYKYYRQSAFYLNITNVPYFYFIVCNSYDCNVTVYKVSQKWLEKGYKEIDRFLGEIKWQQENPENNWKYFSGEVLYNYVIDL